MLMNAQALKKDLLYLTSDIYYSQSAQKFFF